MPDPVPAYSHTRTELSGAQPTALSEITREWAWAGADGAGVRVAVVDSGIEARHPALAGCVDEEAGAVVTLDDQAQPIVVPGPHDDLFGHGTACAGIIHAIAPSARVSSVRVLGDALSGRSDVFLRGLAWAIENRFDVVNLSLGSSKKDWALPFYEMCDRAFFRRTIVVTAANNLFRPRFPSLYSSAVSVASCEGGGGPLDFYSNPEPPVELLAPGIDVDVAWRGSTRLRATGNSYAAPHIAGVCALILSKHPTLRPAELKAVLYATAVNAHTGHPAPGSVGSSPPLSVRARHALRETSRGPLRNPA